MKYEVIVQLKGEVLDPAGRAIKETLQRLGTTALQDVQVSRRFVVDLEDSTNDPKALVESLARDYFANSVAETFTIKAL